MKSDVQILEDAVQIMDEETIEWCQESLAHTISDGLNMRVGSACAVGILAIAAEIDLLKHSGRTATVVGMLPKTLFEAIEKHAPPPREPIKHGGKDWFTGADYLVDFNDTKGTTKEDVRDIFMKTAKGLRDEGVL